MLEAIVPLVLWIACTTAMVGALLFARHKLHSGRRNPLTRDLLRSPAHSLRMRADDVMVDVMALVAIVPVLPLLLYAMHRDVPGGSNVSGWFYVLFAVVAVGYGCARAVRNMAELRKLHLGIEAETAVGQELNWLMREGFAVFHDVPGEGPFNVDHVVLGESGIYAVETKGRSKPLGKDGHRVQQDGDVLKFPGWTDTETIAQARRNAQWLARWLTTAVGQPVEVSPVVCLPGWMVERASRPTVAVINGKNSSSFFTKRRGAPLSDQLVAQIAHQLDARCRDVAPRAYRPIPKE